MNRDLKLNQLIIAGLVVEAVILAYGYYVYEAPGDIYRIAARYSGRFSFLLYLFASWQFIADYRSAKASFSNLSKVVMLFCIMHLIHFVFLALSVYLNEIPMVAYKLTGGFIAYLMIITYPWLLRRASQNLIMHLVYFYYVGIVMAITFLARIKGDFAGAAPSLFHYFGLATVLILFILLSVAVYRHKKVSSADI